MAIEVVEAGYFIPNKAGYPVALSEEPKTTATKAVEEGAASVPSANGLGENINVTA
jgi:hypothetical protein